jgi:hypothetical protein
MSTIPDEVIECFHFLNHSNHNMALGSTQPVTEMGISNLPGGKRGPARKADNPTVICEPILYKMWDPRRLTKLWAFTLLTEVE